jgi:hypothetical protein
METAGLIIGVAGLAGLFNSCLEAVDKVQSYQMFGTDSHVLDTRFKVARAALSDGTQVWGSSKASCCPIITLPWTTKTCLRW